MTASRASECARNERTGLPVTQDAGPDLEPVDDRRS
jgi:hypothetical protein